MRVKKKYHLQKKISDCTYWTGIIDLVCCCCCLVIWLFCNCMDCSPPGSSKHGMSQAGILEWVAISFSRGSFWPRDQTCILCLGKQILYHWTTWLYYLLSIVDFILPKDSSSKRWFSRSVRIMWIRTIMKTICV